MRVTAKHHLPRYLRQTKATFRARAILARWIEEATPWPPGSRHPAWNIASPYSLSLSLSLSKLLCSLRRLHEREQSAGGLLRVHPEFPVRRGAALPGRLGTAAGVADPAGAASRRLGRRRHAAGAAAMRVSATTATPAAKVALAARAAGHRGRRRARVRRAAPRHRALLSSAVPRAAAAQQERAGGPQSSGPLSDSAAASSRHHRHRTDHHQRIERAMILLE